MVSEDRRGLYAIGEFYRGWHSGGPVKVGRRPPEGETLRGPVSYHWDNGPGARHRAPGWPPPPGAPKRHIRACG
jgi:hypothetical protein